MKAKLLSLVAPLSAYVPAFPRVWRMTLYYYTQRQRGFPRVRHRFRTKNGYELNLENPRSLNEKLTHRKLFCRDPLWTQVTDKVAARDWLQRKGLLGEDLKLIPVLGVFTSSEEIRRADLPKRFIAKAAWASGSNFIVTDRDADLPDLMRHVDQWIQESPNYKRDFLIWASWSIPRRIIVEQILIDDRGKLPEDYKFFVFHGRVRFFQVDYDRFQGHLRNLYSRDKSFLEVEYRVGTSKDRTLPNNIDQMIEVAERIGAHFDFVRIDFYSHAGQIYFGEITMTPEDGGGSFRPQDFDFTAGDYWDYPASATSRT